MRPPLDFAGRKFGRLTAVSINTGVSAKEGRTFWHCDCECGNKVVVPAVGLRLGHNISCGCRKITHGETLSREYTSWRQMKHRCTSSTCPQYKNYGARGIKVCDRWMSFETFYEDMGPRPIGCTLERMDNEGNYEPSNCIWANKFKQARNRRACKLTGQNVKFIRPTMKSAALARMFEVSAGHINDVRRGDRWPEGTFD